MDGFEKNILNRINDYSFFLSQSEKKGDKESTYRYECLLSECLDLLVEYRTNYKLV